MKIERTGDSELMLREIMSPRSIKQERGATVQYEKRRS
jgi:hypothetical protein